MLLAAAGFGLGAIFAKLGFARGLTPLATVEGRTTLALLLLVAVLGWRDRTLLRLPRGSAGLLVAFGLSVAVANFCYYFAIDRVPVGVAISVQYTGPVLLLGWTALAARWSRGRSPAPRRRVPWPTWAAATATLAGAALVSRAFESGAGLDPLGLASAAVSAVAFCSMLLTSEALGRRGVHPATVLVWSFGTAVLLWSVVAPWWTFPWDAMSDPAAVGALLGVAVVGTLVPFFLQVGAVQVLPAATAGIALTAEPVFASAFAWLLLAEGLSGVQLVGAALVVAGVAVVRTVEARAAGAAEPDGGERAAAPSASSPTSRG